MCPSGQALRGVTVRVGGMFYGIRGYCGTVAIRQSDTPPYTYSVAVTTPTTTMPARGETLIGRSDSLFCPVDSVVTGMDGTWQSRYIGSLRLRCTSFGVSGVPGSFTIVPNPSTYTVTVSSDVGSSAFDFTCMSGGVTNTIFGETSEDVFNQFLNNLGMGCSPMMLVVR